MLTILASVVTKCTMTVIAHGDTRFAYFDLSKFHRSTITFAILINVVRLDVVIGQSLRIHEFNSRPTHLKSVFGEVAFREVFYSGYFGFPLSVSFCHASCSFTYHRRYVT